MTLALSRPTLRTYEKATGFTLNTHKTKGLLIQTNAVARICQKCPITWCTDKFVRILGVHFNNDYEHIKYFNIQACIHQMENAQKPNPKETFP